MPAKQLALSPLGRVGDSFSAKGHSGTYNIIHRPCKNYPLKNESAIGVLILSLACGCLGRAGPNGFTGLTQPTGQIFPTPAPGNG